MNKYFLSFFAVIFLLALNVNLVSAWGPNTHFSIFTTALSEENETLVASIIQNNYDACLAGLEYPDVGIFYYYTDFKVWAGLHNYNVVSELLRNAKNDRDRAFAYCYKIHLAEDAVSHNYFVPAAIKSTKLPDYIIHPIQELKIEGFYLNPVANRLMERHREFDALVQQATGKDWSADADNLNAIMGGGNFYTKAYTPESTTWFGKFQNGLYKFIALFQSGKTSVNYYQMAVDESKAVLRGETPELDPSGSAALRAADTSTSIWLYAGTFLIFFALIFFLWKKRWI